MTQIPADPNPPVRPDVVPAIGVATSGVNTDLLEFDKQNPRLVTGDEVSTASDEDIIAVLRDISALEELVTSICTNGYLDLEPLIIMGADGGPYRVLEGNRRLAAIKIIKDPALAKACRISVPKQIRAGTLEQIQRVTVWRVAKEADAQAFIGFKHINGPHRWTAYAKARFVSDWYKREKSAGLTIDAIASQLGDDNETIRAYISSIFVLEQAETAKLFDIKNRNNKGPFAFSHLYTALNRSEYQKFLDLDAGWDKEPSQNPIKDSHKPKLKEVLEYLYGNRLDSKPSYIRSQNPDLKHLGEVIVHPVAYERLRSGSTLSEAYDEVRPAYEVFSEALGQANLRLNQAFSAVAKYDGEPRYLEIATSMRETAENLVFLMEKKVKRIADQKEAGGA